MVKLPDEISIQRVANGYIADISNAWKAGSSGIRSETYFVFETFESLTKWLEENFKVK